MMSKGTPRYYEKRSGKIHCTLCPNGCLISNNKSGVCTVRHNKNGELVLPYYGLLSATAVDPIEKKPLYHFHPSRPIFSIGFVGCSFRCPFCQNYSISQSTVRGTSYMSPEKVVNAAKENRSFGIAYTYSEPTIHFEYIMDCASLAREAGLKNVLVTNGYLNPEPAAELFNFIDAANVDLKCFSSEFYKKEIGGNLEPVLEFIKAAAQKIHLEVTTLVIPTKNDSEDEIRAIASFIAEINPDIPFHLSCYYPTYQYSIPRTKSGTVRHLAEIARGELHYVYLGNVGLDETNTYCPVCGNLCIRRSGYSTGITGLENGKCVNCGTDIPVIIL